MTVLMTLLFLSFFKKNKQQKQQNTRMQAVQTKHLDLECRKKCFPGNDEAEELCIKSELIYVKYNI